MPYWLRKRIDGARLGSAARNGRCIAVFAALCLAIGSSAFAAPGLLETEYRISRWETDNGLPENSATAMAQTPDGYLWFGTFNGLVRFDGARFVTFDPSNTPELPSPAVVNIHLHRSGRLWVSTYKGFAFLKDGHWHRAGLKTAWTNRYVRTFSENASGVLCATSFSGEICRIDGDEIVELPQPPQVKAGYVDPAGRVFAVANTFFGHLDGSNWVSAAAAEVVTNGFKTCVAARDGGLWVLCGARLMHLNDGRVTRTIELSTPPMAVWSLVEDEDGFWVPTHQRGLYRISGLGNVELFTESDGLSYNSIRFVRRDRERNLWVGTSGGGLMQFRRPDFRVFGTEVGRPGRPVRVVKTVCEDASGAMLIGTYGGGVARLAGTTPPRIDWATNQSRHYVQSVLVDRRGQTWIGTYDAPALVVRTADGERRVDVEAQVGRSIHALFEDSIARIWIASAEAVVVFEDGKYRPLTHAGASLPRGTCFAEHPTDGSVWIGGAFGIFRHEKGGLQKVSGPAGASNLEVNCLRWEPDAGGTLWVGTANAGLYRWRGGTWWRITRDNGLASDTVSSLLNDGLGNFWIGSNRGIVRASIAACDAVADGRQSHLNGQHFTMTDGLASVECSSGNQPGAARDSQGRLWFATAKGVATIDPRLFQPDTNPPPVLIESASFVDRDGVRRSLDFTDGKPARVPAGSSQLQLHYTSPSFADPAKVRFRHELTLEGRTVDRAETTARSRFSALLPAGGYRFHVTAANHHGFWNPSGATVEFVVAPFFWQTAWFRSLVIGLTLGGVASVVWFVQQGKVRRQRQQLIRERALGQERDRLASAVEKSERALRAFMDALPAPAMLIDRNGLFAAVNRPLSEALGSSPGDRLGTDAYAGIPPEVAAARRSAVQAVFDCGKPTHLEEMIGDRQYDTHLSPVTDSSGAVIGVAVLALDVTRHRQLEAQVRQAQKMEAIGQLAGGIAHDFNNILGAILLSCELGLQDAGPDHPVTESLNEIAKAGRRAKSLVQQILSFSRRQPQDRSVIALGGVVDDAVKFLRATIPAGVEVVSSTQPDVPCVMGNATQLHQVLVNLGTNAWHAVEGRGNRIEIRLDAVTIDAVRAAALHGLRPGPFARLVVKDNGCGMDESTLRRIFEPFFTTKEPGKGTGLGLSVVHGIVRNHDGTVTVKSQPGAGTTFEVFLPGIEASEDSVAVPDVKTPQGQGQRILYLDDEQALVSIATRMLERLGYDVRGFTCVADALAAFRASPEQFDLVITDQNMPDASGLQVAGEILRLRPGMPVVLNSGHVTDDLKRQARIAGIRDIFYKPNTVAEFGEGIHRLVPGSSLQP